MELYVKTGVNDISLETRLRPNLLRKFPFPSTEMSEETGTETDNYRSLNNQP